MTTTAYRVMLVSLLLGVTAVLQSSIADWSLLGLGFFALVPVLLAGMWLGRLAAVVAALCATGMATLSLATGPHPPDAAVIAVGGLIRGVGYQAIGLLVAGYTARLRQVATADPLTGLPNRRAFFERAEGFRGPRQQITVIACDVDDLKGINDREGHPRGDEAIRRVARELVELAGRGALVARVGGDEFVALSTRDPAQLRAAARAGAPTGTVGLAQWGPGRSLDEALLAADYDLYAHKPAAGDRLRSRVRERGAARAA